MPWMSWYDNKYFIGLDIVSDDKDKSAVVIIKDDKIIESRVYECGKLDETTLSQSSKTWKSFLKNLVFRLRSIFGLEVREIK